MKPRIISSYRAVTGIVLFLFAFSSHADNIQDHIFTNIQHPHLKQILNDLPSQLANREFAAAIEKIDENKTWLESADIHRSVKAQMLNNHAIFLATAEQPGQALLTINQAIDLFERVAPFHTDLYNAMMAKSYILLFEEASDEAEDALRHAQHIAHRNDGVYAKSQLPTLQLLTGALTANGREKNADKTQHFVIKVNERIYGADSEDLVPALTKAGSYFATRGRALSSGQARADSVFYNGRNRSVNLSIPSSEVAYRTRLFRESQGILERAVTIVENKYGKGDLRLVEPLKELSRTKFWEGTGRSRAKKPMERMLSIVQENPGADDADKAKALVATADLYVKVGDRRSTELYRQAWALLDVPGLEDLKYELFGKPVRLLPETNFRSTLGRYPLSLEPDQPLFLTANYTVKEDGTVNQAVVVDSNIPLREQRLTKEAISQMKYRPRMVDGEFVATEDLTLRQSFTVKESHPEFKADINVGP